jgi:hypothetical protein
MAPKKQVSPAIRILRGERDASARATHLEAATRKFLVTTNERTQMSSTTNFKRVALVAVAALGLGVLSSAPSQAVIPEASIAVTTTAGTSGQTQGAAAMDSSTAGTVSLSFTATAADSVSVTVIPKAKPTDSLTYPRLLLMLVDTATSSGRTTVGVTDPATATSLPSASESNTTAAVFAAANTIGAAKFYAFIDTATLSTSRTAGTYTWTVAVTPYSVNGTTQIGNTGVVYKDISITVAVVADQSLVIDPTKSTAFLNTTAGQTSDAAISAVATASATEVGVLTVKTYNSSSVARDESVTVSIAGAGVLNVGSVSGTSLVLASSSGVTNINVRPDGRAGVATISVSTPTRTFSNKTVTFYAAAAKTITATVGTPLLAVGANAGAVRGVAVDANGVAWTGTAYIVASSAADALVAGSATTPVSCGAYDTVNLRHNCPVTALKAGTAKFKIIDAATVALATATSNEVTVTVSAASVASVKIEFDKATYAPNERARIYVTPLDATGKAMQSATYTNLLTSTGISVNGALSYTGTLTTADSLTAAGSITTAAQTSATTGARAGSFQYTVYMPAAGGVVTLNATGGTSLPLAAQVALTASASVTDSGAAALAAVTALATTVASLKTLITTLTNLVLKIQKKVKA